MTREPIDHDPFTQEVIEHDPFATHEHLKLVLREEFGRLVKSVQDGTENNVTVMGDALGIHAGMMRTELEKLAKSFANSSEPTRDNLKELIDTLSEAMIGLSELIGSGVKENRKLAAATADQIKGLSAALDRNNKALMSALDDHAKRQEKAMKGFISDLAKIVAAPKRIVHDRNGRPIGVVTEKI